MKFEQALQAMREGKSVTRKAYNDEYLYIMENLNKEPIMFIKKKYEPENCRWATYKEQARNTSRNHCFELNGKIKCAAEWCEELGIKSSTFFQRLKNGLNPFTGEIV